MSIDLARVEAILEGAHARGERVLLEPDALGLLEAIGIPCPRHLVVRDSRELATADTSVLSDRLVIKVVSPEILHKTDVGGVAFASNHPEQLRPIIDSMERRLADRRVVGFLLADLIPFDASLGHELLLGLRWTDDFGPVVTLGAGGIFTEFLAENFKAGRDVAIVSASRSGRANIEAALAEVAVARMLTGRLRGQEAQVEISALVDVMERFAILGRHFAPADINECEINPLVVAPGGLTALDALVTLGNGSPPVAEPRPLWKIARLLQPASVAIIGVSEQLNPGHIILNNLLREGFDPARIVVVKRGLDTIEGCRSVPDIASVPDRVDLFILAISADQVPAAVTEIIQLAKAESLVVIPGGLGEKRGSEGLVARMHAALRDARRTDWQGPIINGGNCLGIRSLPGRYDTMFIPQYKLPAPTGGASPVAMISQSGAFAVARASKLTGVNPRYSISVGNQMDLTVGDYLTHLKDDPEVEVFAVYVEGFKPLDGLKFLEAAAAITNQGRTVIVYRAGRTTAGARASQSHTASVAGDYTVTRQLLRGAGVIVADSLADLDDLVRLFALLRHKRVHGRRLGAVSNAGFECVAIADNLGQFELSDFSQATSSRLQQLFSALRISGVVDVHNPLDLTPMADDGAYEDAVRAVLQDEGIDVGIVGCVPLSPVLQTLPSGDTHREKMDGSEAVPSRMKRVFQDEPKAWVAVVDGGALYDPMVRYLEDAGLPTFRTADRALRLFNVFCGEEIRRRRVSGGRRDSVSLPGTRQS